jgi:GntR family transcriptional regulator
MATFVVENSAEHRIPLTRQAANTTADLFERSA